MKLPDFATRLGWDDAEVLPRLRELGLTRPCSRCAGSGHYTLSDTDSECWKCRGEGDELPMLTRELAGQVAARVVRGELDRYLARQCRRRAAAQYVPSLLDQCAILYDAALRVAPHTAAELMFAKGGVRELERMLQTGAIDAETAAVALHRHRERLTQTLHDSTQALLLSLKARLADRHTACKD